MREVAAAGDVIWLPSSYGREETLERVRCLICSCGRTTLAYRQFGIDIVRCRSCGFVFVSPRLSRGEIHGRYSSEYFHEEYLRAYGVRDGAYDSTGFERRYRPLLDIMAARCHGTGDLLEIGVGGGFFLKEAEKAGWRCVGTEIMDAAIEFATKQLELDVRRQTAEELSFPESSFDAVVLLEVIEHLYEPRKALAAIRSVLRAGGLLVLSTPNFHSLSRVMLGSDWAVLSPAEHLFYFTRDSLARLLSSEGYERIVHLWPQPGLGPVETMNADHAFHRSSLRAQAYRSFVSLLGFFTYRLVQRAGWSDALFVLAERAPERDPQKIPSTVSEFPTDTQISDAETVRSCSR